MSTTTPTAGQALIAMIESDLASVGGQPLIMFLTAIKAANGNLGLEGAALLQLEAAAPGAGIQLGLDIQMQLVNLALAKVQAYVAAKTAKAA